MEIPLTLVRGKDGSLAYGIPVWYRILSGAMLTVVGAAAFSAAEGPGVSGWIVLALLALAFLYEETWRVDSAARAIVHRSGLVVAARRTVIPFDSIEGLALTALARGTVPGSAAEREQSVSAFAQMEGTDAETSGARLGARLGVKRSYINLVIHSREGETFLVDTLPSRRAARLKVAGEAMASACGAPFGEERPGRETP